METTIAIIDDLNNLKRLAVTIYNLEQKEVRDEKAILRLKKRYNKTIKNLKEYDN